MEAVSILEMKNAGFSYAKKPGDGDYVFRHVDFRVGPGERIAVIGPNGAGKTTLLKCLLGFLELREGMCTYDGADIRRLPPRDYLSRISYVPQTRSVPTSYTVRETVLLGFGSRIPLFGSPGAAQAAKADETLREIGILHLSDKRCDALSGGELQMVLIARALVSDPRILVLDEPESGLDFKNQLTVLETLEACAGRGMSCVFNTHYPDHAVQWADRALLLSGGRAVFGPSSDVITEENILEAFGVEAVIQETGTGSGTVKSVVPIKIRREPSL